MFGERNGEIWVVYRTAAATADSPSDIGFGLIPVVTVDKTRCRSGVSVPPSVSAMKAFFCCPPRPIRILKTASLLKVAPIVLTPELSVLETVVSTRGVPS